MQHIRRMQAHNLPVCFRIRAGSAVHIITVINQILIIKPSMFIPVHRHPVRHQRIKCNNLTLSIPDNLTVCIPPQKQMRHQSLPEYKRSHLRIRLIMQQKIKRMIHRLFLSAIIVIPVKLQWQPRHCLRKNPHTGIHRSHLHGTPCVHPLPGSCAPHKKSIPASSCTVRRSIPSPKQLPKQLHFHLSSLSGNNSRILSSALDPALNKHRHTPNRIKNPIPANTKTPIITFTCFQTT